MHEEEFIVKNRAGKRLVAALRTSELSKKLHPKGTVVLLHGLGGWKDQYLLVVVAESLRSDGYYVVTFDAADGAKGPDGNFHKSTNTDYLGDVAEIVAHVRKQSWFTSPLMLAGHSQGEMVALRYAATHPKEVDQLVMIAPATSWTDTLPLSIPFGLWWLTVNRHTTPGPGPRGSRLPLDRTWLLDYMKFNPRKDAEKVQVPALIVSAQKDGLISTKNHAKLVKHFAHGTLKVIPRANHIFFRQEHEVAATILAWRTSL